MKRFVGFGVLLEAGYVAIALAGDLRAHILLYVCLYGLLCLIAWGAWREARASAATGASLGVAIGFAIAFRLTLLPLQPSLSSDIYRYAWEGRIQRAGFSPYALAPNDSRLASFQDALYPSINHKEVPTIYPPFTQLAFRAGDSIGEKLKRPILGQKLVFFLCDLFMLTALWFWLSQRKCSWSAWLLYAWNPLVIIEVAGSAHNDVLGILCLTLALYAFDRVRPWLAGGALGLTFLSKYASALLIPWLVIRRQWKMIVSSALIGTLGVLPFLARGMVTGGAREYAARWQFNGSLYVLAHALFGQDAWAKWSVAGALAAFCLWLAWREKDPAQAVFRALFATLLLAPTVHPWYLLWIIPWLCLKPVPALLAWNGTIGLSYTVHRRFALYHVWNLHPCIQVMEYAPVFALLVWQWHSHRRVA